MKFTVIDTKTGEYPDLWEIALKKNGRRAYAIATWKGLLSKKMELLY